MSVDIDFTGYAPDCHVQGKLSLDENARLSDLLNRTERIVLHDVTLVNHRDGRTSELAELEVDRDELSAVVAAGSRGDPARRVKTRHEELDVQLDGYFIRGYAHAPIAGDPLLAFERRSAMVPLTDALVAYRFCDGDVTEAIDTLLVNRYQALSVKAAEEAIGK